MNAAASLRNSNFPPRRHVLLKQDHLADLPKRRSIAGKLWAHDLYRLGIGFKRK